MTAIDAFGGAAPFVSADRNVSADEVATREADFSFGDFLDMVNPLHHLPVVGTIYRQLTGDTITGPSRIVGGLIFGGPLGMASSIGNAMLEEATGRDLADTVVAAVFGDDEEAPATTSSVAERAPAADVASAPQVAQRDGSAPAVPPGKSELEGDEALSGIAALRAFARDQGRQGEPAAKDLPAEMAAPTTAATSSGQASTRQSAVDEQLAEAALRAAADGAPEQGFRPRERAEQAANPAGTPPPPERFMPLGPRAFSGPVPVSASRAGTALASDEAAADPLGSPDAALGPAGDYRPSGGTDSEPQHPVAQQMMDALLKYQAMRAAPAEG